MSEDLFDSGLPNSEADPEYLRLRDQNHQYSVAAREWVRKLWREFYGRGLAEPGFRKNFARFLLDRYWEMHLARTVTELVVDAPPVTTTSGAVLDAKPFRDHRYEWLSCAIGSGVDPWNVWDGLSGDFEVVANPMARALPPGCRPTKSYPMVGISDSR